MRKKTLRQELDRCDRDRVRLERANDLCRRRLHQFEAGTSHLLEANDDSEMENFHEAIEHLRLLMAQI